MILRMRNSFILLASFALLSGHALADNGADKTWQFSVQPYLLASSIDGDAGVGRVAGVPVSVSFSDILENLDIGAMLHFEAQHSNGWGVALDYGFMNLSADVSAGVGGVLDASVRQGILEAMATRRFDFESGMLEALAGIRWWDNKVRAAFDPGLLPGSFSTTISESWVDPLVGLRWTSPFGDRWHYRLRGDIGGFGIGSDFSWSAKATLLYRMADKYVLEFGYSALDVDYDNGKAINGGFFAYDTITHGPMVGLAIEF